MGGTLIKYTDAGVVCHSVSLTRGEAGQSGPPGTAPIPPARLGELREAEFAESGRLMGIASTTALRYPDGGLASAPADDVIRDIVRWLRSTRPDVVIIWGPDGGYGHPDHIAVHHVGHRAAELAGTPYVYEGTMNRDALVAMIETARSNGAEDFGPDDFDVNSADDGNAFGTPEAELTTRVDVTGYIDQKRESLLCHGSQVNDSSFFLQMPPEAFTGAFGTEWFIRVGAPSGISEDWLAGLSR